MPMLIRILVFAKDAEGALDAAREVVYEKIKTWNPLEACSTTAWISQKMIPRGYLARAGGDQFRQ